MLGIYVTPCNDDLGRRKIFSEQAASGGVSVDASADADGSIQSKGAAFC